MQGPDIQWEVPVVFHTNRLVYIGVDERPGGLSWLGQYLSALWSVGFEVQDLASAGTLIFWEQTVL